MPYACPYWSAGTPFAVKPRDICLYEDDGSQTGQQGVPTGIPFAGHRPALLECIERYPRTVSFGVQRLDLPENSNNVYYGLLDTSAVLGPGADDPGNRATYSFNPRLAGSSGDGTATPGGWHVLAHFVPLSPTNTQQAVGAVMQIDGAVLNSGSHQAVNSSRDSCPFYLDLQPLIEGSPANPAVFTWDPSNVCNVNVPGAGAGTDAFSGETPRFLGFWAGPVSDWTAPDSTPALPSPFSPYTAATTVGTTGAADVNVNTELADTINFLNNPPMFRSKIYSTQNIDDTTNTKVTLSTDKLDNYGGYDAGTSTYTVQRDGLYLVHGITPWSNNSGTAQRVTGVSINGTIYWGPGYKGATLDVIDATIATVSVATTKTQIFSLRAGDTVQLHCRQNSGSSLALSGSEQSRLLLVWLGAPVVPSTLWNPPDTSYRWQAGTRGAQLPALFQAHIANDLSFLVQRPYLMAWQSTAQSGFSSTSWNNTVLNRVTGIVHSDNGDNYGGWVTGSSNRYVAVRAGWYLCVGEFFSTYPNSPPSSVAAGINTLTSGGRYPVRSPDWGQHMVATTANFPPGATVFAMYYLLAGEYVQPQILGQDMGGTWGTQQGTVNGGQVNSHFECIWLCE